MAHVTGQTLLQSVAKSENCTVWWMDRKAACISTEATSLAAPMIAIGSTISAQKLAATAFGTAVMLLSARVVSIESGMLTSAYC